MAASHAAYHYNPDDRLVALEVVVADNSKKLDRLVDIMEGPSGLLVRLDRMEQERKRTQWFNRAIAVAVIGVMATSVLPKLVALLSTLQPALTP